MQSVNNMKQRLEQFLAAENISRAQFADSINVARAGISHILSGRNNPSYEFIVNTMAAYPQLNIEWLLRGTGKMYKNDAGGIFDTVPEPDIFEDETEAPQAPVAAPVTPVAPVFSSNRKAKRVIVYYDDNTYEEFC